MKNNNSYLQKQLDGYCKSVKKALKLKRSDKAEIINQLKNSIEDYIECNPSCDFSDIERRFGSPESIANEYREGFEAERENRAKTNSLLKSAAIVVAVLIMLCAAITAWSIIDAKDIPTKEISSFDKGE